MGSGLASPARALSILTNGGFELPALPAGTFSFIENVPLGPGVPGWTAVNASNKIELLTSGSINNVGIPIYAFEGNQFIEVLGQESAGSVTQPLNGLASGSRLFYSFAHRGRVGTDIIRLSVTDSSSAVVFTQLFQTDQNNWVQYSGPLFTTNGDNYILSFTSESSFTSDSRGNFLDAVSLRVDVPGPLPLLGATAAFAYTRKLRRRIKLAKS